MKFAFGLLEKFWHIFSKTYY